MTVSDAFQAASKLKKHLVLSNKNQNWLSQIHVQNGLSQKNNNYNPVFCYFILVKFDSWFTFFEKKIFYRKSRFDSQISYLTFTQYLKSSIVKRKSTWLSILNLNFVTLIQ